MNFSKGQFVYAATTLITVGGLIYSGYWYGNRNAANTSTISIDAAAVADAAAAANTKSS